MIVFLPVGFVLFWEQALATVPCQSMENEHELNAEDQMASSEATEETIPGLGDLQPSPEFLQRKLYFLLEHLKEMHSELPE